MSCFLKISEEEEKDMGMGGKLCEGARRVGQDGYYQDILYACKKKLGLKEHLNFTFLHL